MKPNEHKRCGGRINHTKVDKYTTLHECNRCEHTSRSYKALSQRQVKRPAKTGKISISVIKKAVSTISNKRRKRCRQN